MKVMKNGKEWTTDSINARAILGERARNVFEAYNNAKPYVVNNKVAYEGSSYVNILASTGVLPTDETHWLLIAAKGADGTIGTIGTDGADGLSAYEIAVNNGYVGTEAEWVASLSLVPTELTGQEGKVLSVNDTGDGLIYEEPFYTDGGELVESFELGYPLIERSGDWTVSSVTSASGSSFLKAPVLLPVDTSSSELFTFYTDTVGTLSLKYIIDDDVDGQLRFYLDDALLKTDAHKTTFQTFSTAVGIGSHVFRVEYYLNYNGNEQATVGIDDLSIPAGRVYKHSIKEHAGIPSFVGNAGKALAVNETEDGLVLADIASAATDVRVTDAGTYYTGTDAETVLQEIGATLITKADVSALALKADTSALYSGATLLTGTTDPTDDMGQDGDVYIKYY